MTSAGVAMSSGAGAMVMKDNTISSGDRLRHEKKQKKLRKKVRKVAKRALERMDRVAWMNLEGEAMDQVRSAFANAMKELRRIVQCTKRQKKTKT